MARVAWNAAQAADIVAAHKGRDGALLPMLHALQDAFGYVDRSVVPVLAETLNLSRAEVFGVLTFYHDFREHPAGRHVVKLCRAEACQSNGAVALADYARRRLGIDWHGTTTDGQITLEPVFCLGLCACGPSALIDGEPVCRLDPDGFDRHVAEFAS